MGFFLEQCSVGGALLVRTGSLSLCFTGKSDRMLCQMKSPNSSRVLGCTRASLMLQERRKAVACAIPRTDRMKIGTHSTFWRHPSVRLSKRSEDVFKDENGQPFHSRWKRILSWTVIKALMPFQVTKAKRNMSLCWYHMQWENWCSAIHNYKQQVISIDHNGLKSNPCHCLCIKDPCALWCTCVCAHPDGQDFDLI